MRIFLLSNCDTCRKALKALRAAGHAPEVIDIRKDGITPPDRAAIVAALGEAAVNKRSATWRGLDEAARGLDLTELLAAYPTVMKRPVIERAGDFTAGWDAAIQARFLG